MIVTARAPGLRARLRRAARVTAATLATFALLLPAHVATADTSGDEPTAGEVELLVTPSDSGLVGGAGPARVTVTLTNASGAALDAGRFTLEVGSTPLTDETALATWLGAGTLDGAFTTHATAATPAVGAGREHVADLFTGDLPALTPGIYPLRVRFAGATGSPTASAPESRSVLIAPTATRPISLLIPVTLTPSNGVLLSADELAIATATGGPLAAVLDAVSGTTAALAVDPAIPAAIRVLGSAAPESAQQWLTQLEALPNTRFALQFGDADLTAQAQAGLAAPLTVTGLTSFLDPANFVPTATGQTPAPGATEPALPDLGELTSIRNSLPGLIWPRGEIEPADLETFASYFDTPVTTVLPWPAAPTAPAPAARSEGQAILLYEAGASTALSRAIAESDAAPRGAALTAALAQLQIRGGTEPVLLALDRDETRTAEALQEALDALAAVSTPLRLEDLLVEIGPEVAIQPSTQEARAAAVPTLLADEEELAAFSSILTEPAMLTERERIRILRLLAVTEPEGGFATVFAAHREATASTLAAVGIEPSSDVQILSASVDLPVWVRNDLPWPITVTLAARSNDTRLEVQAETVVEAPAQNNTRARVPVRARVASGEVDVRLRLTSATGVPIGTPEVTRVIVRAEWENIGLVVLGVVVALLLVFGTVRTVRRKRRVADAASDSPAS